MTTNYLVYSPCVYNRPDDNWLLEVPQQEEFYRSRIQTSDTKVFVIISDAMRYEVAAAIGGRSGFIFNTKHGRPIMRRE